MIKNNKTPILDRNIGTIIKSPRKKSFGRFIRNKLAVLSFVILLLFSFLSIFAPWVTTFHYNEGNMQAGNMPWRLNVYKYDWTFDQYMGSNITIRPNDHTIHFLDDAGKFIFKEEPISQVTSAEESDTKKVYLSLHDEEKPPMFTVQSDVTNKLYMFRGDDFSLREIVKVEGNHFDYVKEIEPAFYDEKKSYAKYVINEDLIEVNWTDSKKPIFKVNNSEYLLNETLDFHSIKINENLFYTTRDNKEISIIEVDGENITIKERIAPVEADMIKDYVRFEIDDDIIEVVQQKIGLKTRTLVFFNGELHNEEKSFSQAEALEEQGVSDKVSDETKKHQNEHEKLNKLADRKRTFDIYHVHGEELFVDWSKEKSDGIITVTTNGEALTQDKQLNKSYILGTDVIGRCIYSRLVYGGRISLSVGLVATSISILLGLVLGSISGYYGGIVDSFIMRLTEVVMSFPFLLICIAMSAILGPSIYNVMLIIGLLGWPSITRMVRAQIFALKEQEFLEAAVALGIRDRNIIIRHLWPNVMATIIVYATLGMSGAILSEAGLSYLGLGVQPPMASWGNMLSHLTHSQIESMPWLWFPAGLAIFVTVISLNILGDGLRDALDPKLKK